MNKPILILVIAFMISVAGCKPNQQPFQPPVASSAPIFSPTIEPSSTLELLRITPTTVKPVGTLSATITRTLIPISQTPTPPNEDTISGKYDIRDKTDTPFPPTPTFTPTATPVMEVSRYLKKGYEQIFSGSIPGPNGEIYSIFGVTDPKLNPLSGLDVLSPEVCRLLFYRNDGVKNTLIGSLGAPASPKSENFTEYTTYPVECSLINWDEVGGEFSGVFSFFIHANPDYANEIRQALHLNHYMSDINQNGLPEFTVSGFYCSNGCSTEEFAIHFYEIQGPHSVVDITGQLPGVILPWRIIHSKDPFTLAVWDISQVYKRRTLIETYWIYQWDGKAFKDVSSQHANDYRVMAEPLVEGVKAGFGSPFDSTKSATDLEVLTIFSMYQKAGLRNEGLDLFLELTDPVHWPGTPPYPACWLQLSRARAQIEFKLDQPFTLPIPSDYLDLAGPFSTSQYIQQNPEYASYDLSACKSSFP
jgi:hypothetical protein